MHGMCLMLLNGMLCAAPSERTCRLHSHSYLHLPAQHLCWANHLVVHAFMINISADHAAAYTDAKNHALHRVSMLLKACIAAAAAAAAAAAVEHVCGQAEASTNR
jgi:hypothetical protein